LDQICHVNSSGAKAPKIFDCLYGTVEAVPLTKLCGRLLV
jgi:hypothetical protein